MSAAARAPGADDVASPCISVCTLDATQTRCLGCQRTLHDIATWVEMSAADKRAVIAALPARAAGAIAP